MIDSDAKESYLESGGYHCPFCDSQNIDSGPIHSDGENFVADVKCLEKHCGKTWRDIYRISDVEEVE